MSAAAVTRRPAAELTSGHLWQLDVVRVLTFCAVIAVHSIDVTQQPSNVIAAGALMLLQFGREVFFVLTGFVLVYAARGRTPTNRSFWRHRLPTAILPYLAWTVIYYVYSIAGPAHLGASWSGLWADIVSGNAEYHLYFLLVIMQLYVIFPALLRFVRRTSHHAWPILAAVAAVNLAWLAALHSVAPPTGPAGFLWRHAYELLPTYLIYVLAGCYAALHLAELQAFAHRRSRYLTAGALAGAALAVAAYAAQLASRAPRDAGAVLQPAMLLCAFAAVILLYLAGSRWAAGPRRHEGLLRTASDISFGVYLAHPLVLALLMDHGLAQAAQGLSSIFATMIGIVVPLVVAAALTLAIRRTPASFVLAGRPWVGKEVRAQEPSALLGPATAANPRWERFLSGAGLTPVPAFDRDAVG